MSYVNLERLHESLNYMTWVRVFSVMLPWSVAFGYLRAFLFIYILWTPGKIGIYIILQSYLSEVCHPLTLHFIFNLCIIILIPSSSTVINLNILFTYNSRSTFYYQCNHQPHSMHSRTVGDSYCPPTPLPNFRVFRKKGFFLKLEGS